MIGSPTPRGRPHRDAVGFTLIEVLVVVAITGIVIALASVNLFPSDAEVARREAGRIALAVERARDQAWFGGRPTAVSFDAGRLRTWRRSRNAWEPEARDAALGDDVRVTALSIDGHALPLGERIVFLPDGLGDPFRVALEVRGLPWAVEGDVAGAVTVVAR